MSASTGAKLMSKFYNNLSGMIGASWEDVLLDNARRVSAPLAIRMLDQIGLNSATSTPFKLFDSGCGAGVVAAEVHRVVQPSVLAKSSVLCGDYSEQVIGLVKKRIEGEGWIGTEARKVDAQKTELESASFTHMTMNIGFHVVPDSEAALDEAIRVLKPGGILGFTTWTGMLGWAPDMEEAFKSFPFEAPFKVSVQTTPWGNWGDVNWVRDTLEKKGLQDVRTDVTANLHRVDGPDHYIGTLSMIIKWLWESWPEELKKEHGFDEVEGLVKEFVDKKYDGKEWDLIWVAIVASGRVV
ncbi:hypothetical protein OQA88_2714 [Cercophora sp. LCS_1]